MAKGQGDSLTVGLCDSAGIFQPFLATSHVAEFRGKAISWKPGGSEIYFSTLASMADTRGLTYGYVS